MYFIKVEKSASCRTFKIPMLLKTGEWLLMNLKNKGNSNVMIAFHELDDLPVETYPYFWIKSRERSLFDIQLRKKIIVTESTRMSPCGNQYPEVCKEIENVKLVQEKFKCYSLFLNSGPHLENDIDKTLPNCSLQQIREAFTLMEKQKISSKCQDMAKCERVLYEITSKTPNSFEEWLSAPKFKFFYQDTFVEQHWNYISYDAFNLIAEIGGVLGLTLGLSGVSITFTMGKLFFPNTHV